MKGTSLIRKFIIGAALALAPAASFAGIFISVGFAPPALPVYTQPICPGDGYLWNPGYWAYGDDGYYWVPGVWVQPPSVGVLWTPGYWGWGSGAYIFHEGYWGPHVGFYGGINYGFGFGGFGFSGGEWRGGSFAYNTAYTNVNTTVIHNTYINKTTINNTTINNNSRTSFNGGTGGVQARPTPQEAQAEHENHIPPTSVQQSHVQAARAVPANFAKANGGHPAMAAIQRPGAMNTAVAARGATTVPQRAANQQGRDATPRNQAAADRTANNGPVNQQDRQQFNQRQNTVATQANARPAYQTAPRQQAAAPRQQVAPRPEPQAAPRQQAAPRAEPRPQAAPRAEPHAAPHAESHPAPHAEPHGEGNHGHR